MRLAILVAAAGVGLAAPTAARPQPADWHAVATVADRARLHGWRGDWVTALAAVRAHQGEEAIARDPALFDPDHAADDPMPPAGGYRCRVTKLGERGVAAGEWGACDVTAGDRARGLARRDGAQRFSGTIFDDGPHHAIFLGAASFADERRPAAYGRAAGRDMIGRVERIGERRWRIALPSPRFESRLDLIELVPAG